MPAGTLHVAAGAAAGGDGSAQKPFASLAQAVAKAGDGGTVALGKGTWIEQLQIKKPLTVIGLCAAQTRIEAPGPGAAAVLVSAPAAAAVQLRGLAMGGPGPALVVTQGDVDVQDVALLQAVAYGVRVEGAAAHLSLARASIGAVDASAGTFGDGVSAATGAVVHLEDVSIAQVHRFGVAAVGKAQVQALRLQVRDVQVEPASKDFGVAIAAGDGASVLVAGGALARSRDCAVRAAGLGVQVQLTGVDIADVLGRPSVDDSGYGLRVEQAASVALFGCSVRGALAVGALANGAGSTITLRGTSLADTQVRPIAQDLGWGAYAQDGATLHIDGSLLTGNRAAAVHVRGAGSHAWLRGSLIGGSLPDVHTGKMGVAVAVQDGGQAWLAGCRLQQNRFAGAVASGTGALLTLIGCEIDGTTADDTGFFGQGILAIGASTVRAFGCNIHGNHEGGIALTDTGTTGQLAGLLLSDTQPRESNGAFGEGLIVLAQATADLTASRLVNNHLAAAVVDHATLHVDGCVLANSQAATWQDDKGRLGQSFADGLLAFQAVDVALRRSLTVGHPRAGMLLDSCAQATLEATGSFGNAFGLAIQGTVAGVTQLANAFAGNAEQDEAVDQGLVVPGPPPLGKLEL